MNKTLLCNMVCDCLVVSAGYCVLAVVAYKIVVAVYNVVYPYLIGTPVDLHSMAGAKWAGPISQLLFCSI
ncbi:hypothetical protein OSTOST_03988 [Ostertagia ostertagi]